MAPRLFPRSPGWRKSHTEIYRGSEDTVELLPKGKVEIVLPDRRIDDAVAEIANAVKTGKIGDGKVFASSVEDAIPSYPLQTITLAGGAAYFGDSQWAWQVVRDMKQSRPPDD